MSYRVLIPTAGVGSRLGHLTKHINKSLVSVGNRPTLSHQIEQFPPDCEFVIALGHKGDLVRQFLELAYPNKRFHFVSVSPFEGKGSGLGYTLICCANYLQQPFVFLSCDTLVTEVIPSPIEDWMGYANLTNSDLYRTLEVKDNRVNDILEKGAEGPGTRYPYIGLAGVANYRLFWDAMLSGGSPAIEQGEAYGLRRILIQNSIRARQFDWQDAGTVNTLQETRIKYTRTDEPNILEKETEAIWLLNKEVIKFSTDKTFIQNRVKRSKILSAFVPSVVSSSANLFTYHKVNGQVLSAVVNLPLFHQLLTHAKRFWKPAKLSVAQKSEFQERCYKFYKLKTEERVDAFYKKFDRKDGTEPINNEKMPTLAALLSQVDWRSLSNGLPGRFHGDFHFENILWDYETGQFTFLDWRQDFAGDLQVGDIYYDLAKLLHGLIVSHDLIAKDHFQVNWVANQITFKLLRKQELVECEQYFYDWCRNNGYSPKRVRLITALVYLNIAALHHFPYSLLLFALGKRLLNHELIRT